MEQALCCGVISGFSYSEFYGWYFTVGFALPMAGKPALGIEAASFFVELLMAGTYVWAWLLKAGWPEAGLVLLRRKDIADSPTRRGTPK